MTVVISEPDRRKLYPQQYCFSWLQISCSRN